MAQTIIWLQCRRPGFNSWVGKIPWRRKWQPTPVFLPGESHGQRSLVGYSPCSCKESDTTERLHFHFHFTELHRFVFYKFFTNWRFAATLSSKPTGAIFPTVFTHFMSLCHILVILAIYQIFHYYYICYSDQWFLTYLLQKRPWLTEGSDNGSHFLAIKYFKLSMYIFWHNAIGHLRDYSVNIASICTREPKNFMWLTLLQYFLYFGGL